MNDLIETKYQYECHLPNGTKTSVLVSWGDGTQWHSVPNDLCFPRQSHEKHSAIGQWHLMTLTSLPSAIRLSLLKRGGYGTRGTERMALWV